MKLINYYLFIITLAFISCATSKNNTTDAEKKALSKLIEKKQFTIKSDWAYPQVTVAMQRALNSGILQPGNSAGNINLIGNTNFLTISGDTITSFLPYFGERQTQIDYGGGDNTIKFSGLIKNYKVIKNKNQSYDITFNAKSNNESFNVYIKLRPNLSSELVLNGSSRTSIRYTGAVKPKL
ncbi:DUF4251 domain-containing protein [Thalassobellus sediminis]|uniref:DUF4251 domain-containing protein n=1 Tax=Thalassobellus sediminis TaxID=3367753 RepID=UPI00378E3DBF